VTRPCLAAFVGCSLLVQTSAQEQPPEKPKSSAKKKSEADIRAEVEKALPNDGETVFVFITIEKSMERMSGKSEIERGPIGTGSARKVKRTTGRKETVDLLVEHLRPRPDDLVLREGANPDRVMLGDILKMKQRSWEFVAAFPATPDGEKQAAKAVDAAKKRIVDEAKAEQEKKAKRKKLLDGLGK